MMYINYVCLHPQGSFVCQEEVSVCNDCGLLQLQEKRKLVRQVDELEHSLRLKADEVEELKGRLEEELKLFDEERHQREQVTQPHCTSIHV